MKMLSNLPQSLSVFRGTFLFIVCLAAVSSASAQCNTVLKKLLAEKSVNNDDRFGSALAASGQYMVVGAESSDTLGILYAGAAFVFEKTAAGWAYRAMLTASDPDENDFFGNDVAIDDRGNTIVVINRRYSKGVAYIFEKPASGWESMHETARVVLPDYLEYTAAVDIKEDGSTIVVSGNQMTTCEFYTLDKPGAHWINGMTPQKTVYTPPPGKHPYFGMDIVIQGEYIYASADNGDVGVHVFKRNGATYQHIAMLSVTVSFGQVGYFGRYMTVQGDQIATTGLVFESGNEGEKIFVFKKNGGEWMDAVETAQFKMPYTRMTYFPLQFISPTEIVASIFYQRNGEEQYTGELQIVSTQDGSWQDLSTEVIFQQTGLHAFSEFDAQLTWNGTELLRSVSAVPVGRGGRSAVVTLTRSTSSPAAWGSLQYAMLPRQSSSNVNFGSAVLRTPDALFAGAPYDDAVGKDAGAVYIYEKMGEDFVKTHTLYPSARTIRPAGGSDAGFGHSLAIHNNELAVGATSYRNSANQYGKIFLYRRSGASWTSAVLYDSLIAPTALDLNHVGTALVMNDKYLFASAYNNLNGEHTNALLVYEKIAGKWTFQELLKIGTPLDKSWPSLRLSLYENQLAVGSYFTIDGGVTIFEKNQGTGKWEPQHVLLEEVFSGFGADVKLESNHLFVGVPGYDFQGVAKSGAVFIYTRLPGEVWSEVISPSAIVGAKVPVEGGYFGSSLDVIGNTLVVGAPGKFLTENAQVRTVPGNSYVIQAEDYFWTRRNQVLVLQGDRYASQERDHFGADVGVDEEYFYIGARNENTDTGMFSGAVYYIPTPPVLFLHPPACIGAGPIQLKGYPFNGTWSGSGIEDPAGLFNPALAGEGISILTYTTPNCLHQGSIQIEVTTGVAVQQLSPAAVTLCDQPVTLRVGPASSVQWFYQPSDGSGYVSLGISGSSRQVTNPGQYYARTTDALCPTESAVFTLSLEDFTMTIGPQNVICDPGHPVSLNVSNATGTWTGPGVAGGLFNPAGLANGIYRLTYRITTPNGCTATLKDSIKIDAVAPFMLTRVPEDYCETGAATLQAQAAGSLDYTWYYGETVESMQQINKPLQAVATVYEPGHYYASATNGNCAGRSDTVSVGFSDDLLYTLSPEENSTVTLCSEEEFTLAVQSRAGAQYTWEYKAPDEDSYLVLSGASGPEMIVRENGTYRVNGRYGFCSFASQPVSVEFSEDVLYVPNVFTPNGDVYNNVFQAETTYSVTNLRIMNRYGQEVHSNATGVWDGGNVTSGTYFWILTYTDCDQHEMTAKGWVQVVK